MKKRMEKIAMDFICGAILVTTFAAAICLMCSAGAMIEAWTITKIPFIVFAISAVWLTAFVSFVHWASNKR